MAKGPGFVTSSMVSFRLAASRNGYSNTDGNRLIRRLDEAIRNLPITQVSAVAGYPLLTGGSWNNPITIQADRRNNNRPCCEFERRHARSSFEPWAFEFWLAGTTTNAIRDLLCRNGVSIGNRERVFFVKRFLDGQPESGGPAHWHGFRTGREDGVSRNRRRYVRLQLPRPSRTSPNRRLFPFPRRRGVATQHSMCEFAGTPESAFQTVFERSCRTLIRRCP